MSPHSFLQWPSWVSSVIPPIHEAHNWSEVPYRGMHYTVGVKCSLKWNTLCKWLIIIGMFLILAPGWPIITECGTHLSLYSQVRQCQLTLNRNSITAYRIMSCIKLPMPLTYNLGFLPIAFSSKYEPWVQATVSQSFSSYLATWWT